MGNIRVLKLITIVLPCAALAIVVAAQALGGVSQRSAPEQSAALFPANGLAKEQFAFRTFQGAVEDGRSLAESAELSVPIAKDGLANDPLAPKAYAILALAEQNSERKTAILELANTINRRDISLQGLVLQMHLENNDYPAVVGTLNQILRVHPDLYGDFFPVLVEALKEESSAPLFASILDGSSPWHERFLLFAVRDERARLNLATIRDRIAIENPAFDAQLIKGLVEQGEAETAFGIYSSRSRTTADGDWESGIPWNSDFPPFDWALADERDFRSQTSRDGERLELFARSGQGGVIARRIIPAPPPEAQLRTELTMRAQGRSDGVRLLARCAQSGETLFDEPLSQGENILTITPQRDACSQLLIEVNARARRGEPTLRAELSQLQITAN